MQGSGILPLTDCRVIILRFSQCHWGVCNHSKIWYLCCLLLSIQGEREKSPWEGALVTFLTYSANWDRLLISSALACKDRKAMKLRGLFTFVPMSMWSWDISMVIAYCKFNSYCFWNGVSKSIVSQQGAVEKRLECMESICWAAFTPSPFPPIPYLTGRLFSLWALSSSLSYYLLRQPILHPCTTLCMKLWAGGNWGRPVQMILFLMSATGLCEDFADFD